ncbi:MAG: EAL domain-containing protein [Alphaproteobacteria bacterium]|nr:MAG: EAL domain-containing protein [Alphaproteobacteria bacterium]
MNSLSLMSIASSQPVTDCPQEASELERLRLALKGAGEIVYESLVVSEEIIWADNAGAEFARNGLSPFRSRRDFLSLITPKGAAALASAIDTSIRQNEPFCVVYQVRLPQGGTCWIEDRGSCVCDDTGRLIRVVGVLRFVTEQKDRETRLSYLATYDDLTGLVNRGRLRTELSRTLERCWSDGESGGFLVIGIDNLALFNESLGYEVADDLIVEVGKRLQDVISAQDTVGRLSGNKFGVILRDCTNDYVLKVLQKLRADVQESAIYTKAGPVSVTISTGYVLLPGTARTALEAMARGEESLSHAKGLGRDKVYCYESNEESEVSRRAKMKVADQIMTAINSDKVLLHYQPIVDAVTEEASHFECLVRIANHEGDLVPAYQFVPVAEEFGLIRALDKKVLELAVKRLESMPGLRLTLNASGMTTTDIAWVRKAVELLEGRRSLAERLTVEITETVALTDMAELKNFVAILREMGCQVAIDDFGAGYTSYRNLQTLDVDMVKIDGVFVRDLALSQDNQFYVRALAELAHYFGLKCVAECVETAEEASLLRELGVDFLQGYYYSKPIEAPEWHRSELDKSA